MYLREIGRVGLLKAADERKLAREMEEWKHIDKVEEELSSIMSRRPRAWQTVHQFLVNLSASEDLLDAFCRYHALRKPVTLQEMLTDEDLTDALNGELPEEMLNFIAEILNREPDDIKEEIRELSLNSRLLPEEIHDIFEVSPNISQLSHTRRHSRLPQADRDLRTRLQPGTSVAPRPRAGAPSDTSPRLTCAS